MAEGAEYTYDVFISYARADRAWVEGYLLDAMKAAGVRVHAEEAFRLGVPRLAEFQDAVRRSQRTVLVLSPAYLARDGFDQFFSLVTQVVDLETEASRVIPIVLRPVESPASLAPLAVLDATAPDRWPAVIERLCAELGCPPPGPAPSPPCPYPGMVPFTPGEARFFYGRENEIEELWRRLRQRYVLIVGPPGSGKSSLISAGLIPIVHERQPDYWLVREIRPGGDPLAALVQTLAPHPPPGGSMEGAGLALQGASQTEDWEGAVAALLARNPPHQHLLLVIDQFEQVFAQTPKEKWAAFFRAIRMLRVARNCTLVLALRADSYPDLMASDLWPVYPNERLEITPLRGHDLRDAIALPAERQGVTLSSGTLEGEAGLLERLLVDAADEPAVLPLVQETMRLLWQRMERRLLPLSAYEQLGDPSTGEWQAGRGGLGVAIATLGDATLAALSPQGQAIARRIFLRLVQFGEGRTDTCRQQPVSALRTSGDDAVLFQKTLKHLADNRLLILSSQSPFQGEASEELARLTHTRGIPESVVPVQAKGDVYGEVLSSQIADMSHEVLITEWPRLRNWLEEYRQGEQTRRRLEARAEAWLREGGGKAGLLEGVELLEAERWLAPHRPATGPMEGAGLAGPDASELGASETLLALVRASRAAQGEGAGQGRHAPRFRLGALGVIMVLIIAALGFGLWRAQQNAARQSALAEGEKQRRQQVQQTEATAQALADTEATARAEAEARRVEAVNAEATALAQLAAAQGTARAEATARLETAAGPQATAEAYRLEATAAQAKAEAEHNRAQIALARQLAGQALGHLDDLDRALLLSLEAYRIADEIESAPEVNGLGGEIGLSRAELRSSLLAALTSSPQITTFLHGHAREVNSLAFSPVEGILASGSSDRTIILWNVETDPPEPIGDPLAGHDHTVTAVVFSPDTLASRGTGGRLLASGGDDGAIILWNPGTGQPVGDPLEGHTGSVNSLAFSPADGRILASASSDATVILWDVETGERINTLRGHSDRVNSVAFSADGQTLASAGRDGIIRLWNVDTGALVQELKGHSAWVQGLAFSPDTSQGQVLASGGGDHTIRLWDVETGQPLGDPLIGHADGVTALVFSPDTLASRGTGGTLLASSSLDQTIILWDLETRQRIGQPLTGHAGPVRALAFSPDGGVLASGGNDSAVILWNLQRELPAIARPLSGHDAAVNSLAFSPDTPASRGTGGEILASGSIDGSIMLWDVKTGDPLGDPLAGHDQPVNSVTFSPDGELLASGSDDQTIILWDVETGEPLGDPLEGHSGAVNSVAFDPEGRILASGSDDSTIILWDVRTREPIGEPLEGHSGPVESVVFSPNDDEFLLSGARGRLNVGLWDVRSGTAFAITDVHGIDGALSVAFGPDPEIPSFASGGSDGRILLTTQGSERFLTGHTGGVNSLAFSPDTLASRGTGGTLLASGGNDGWVILWDVPTGQAIGRLAPFAGQAGPDGEVTSVAFSPGGNILASGGEDKTIILWDLDLDSWQEQACRIANRNLTLDEWDQFIGPDIPYRRTCPDMPPGEGSDTATATD